MTRRSSVRGRRSKPLCNDSTGSTEFSSMWSRRIRRWSISRAVLPPPTRSLGWRGSGPSNGTTRTMQSVSISRPTTRPPIARGIGATNRTGFSTNESRHSLNRAIGIANHKSETHKNARGSEEIAKLSRVTHKTTQGIMVRRARDNRSNQKPTLARKVRIANHRRNKQKRTLDRRIRAAKHRRNNAEQTLDRKVRTTNQSRNSQKQTRSNLSEGRTKIGTMGSAATEVEGHLVETTH